MKEFDESILHAEDQIVVVEVLRIADLSERERYVFGRRHGIFGTSPNLSAIGEELSLSREAIRQISNQAESKVTRKTVSCRVLPAALRLPVDRCACGKYRGPRFPGIVCERCATTVRPFKQPE